MPKGASLLPPALVALLKRHVRRWSALQAWGWVSLALAALMGLFLLSLLLDRVADLPAGVRVLLPVLTLATPLLMLLWAVVVWWRKPSADWAAGQLDAALPEGRDILRSSLNFSGREEGSIQPFILSRTQGLARDAAEELARRTLLHTGWIWRRIAIAAALGVVLAGLAATPWLPMRLMWQRFLDPFGNHPRPSMTVIGVQAPERQVLAQGDDLRIEVELTGRLPDPARAELVVQRADGERRFMMSPLPGHRFTTELATIHDSLSFTVEAGDGRSARYWVDVEPRPRLQEIAVRYDYPRYTRLPRQEEELKYRELKGVPGTQVWLTFSSSLPVADSWVEFPNRRYRIAWDRDRREGSFRFSIETDTIFKIHLQADNGHANLGETPFRVRALPDNPPTVTVRGLPEPATFFREDMLTLDYSASDDFGISELFLRAWAGMSNAPKFYSIQLDKSVTRNVEGSVSVKLSEFAGDDDTSVQIELVATDTRGQESATPRMELTIIAETPDRQLAELILIHEEFLSLAYRSRLRENVERLRAQEGQLRILLDGMDASTPLEGTRLTIFQGVFNNLRGIDVFSKDPWLIWSSEFPYLSQRITEYAMSVPWMLRTYHDYNPLGQAILQEEAGRYERLKALHEIVRSEMVMAELILQANEDILKESRLRLIGFLAEKSWQVLSRAETTDEEVRIRLVQQRRELIQQLLEIGTVIDDEALSELLAPLRELASAQLPDEAKVVQALAELRLTLLTGSWLDGHLGAAAQRLSREWPWARLMRRAVEIGLEERMIVTLDDYLRFRQDTPVPEEAEHFLLTRALAAMNTGDAERIESAAKALDSHWPWAERYALLEVAQLLRLRLHERRIDAQVGRRLPEDPHFDRAWQEIRELYLTLERGRVAGRWSESEAPVAAALAALSAYKEAFLPWQARLAWREPEFGTRMARLDEELGALIRLIEPQVVTGTTAALAEWPRLAEDLVIGMRLEFPRLTAEQAEYRREVEEGLKKKPTLTKVEQQDSKWWWARAEQERYEYTIRLVGRMRGAFTAIDRLLALREWLWVRAPDGAALEELKMVALLVGHFEAMDEEIYDLTWAAHLNRPGGQYPNWLNPIHDYLGKLRDEILPQFIEWYELVRENPTALARNEPFLEVTARRAAAPRYTEWLQALKGHVDFLALLREPPDEPMRQRLLLEYASGPLRSVYWDRVALALDGLRESVEGGLPADEAQPFAGLPPERMAAAAAAGAYLATIVPAGDQGAEYEMVQKVLRDWSYYAGEMAPAKVASLPAERRTMLVEDVREWLGRLEGTRRGLEDFLRVPPPNTQPRRRWTGQQRYDVMNVLGRLLRSEARWTERVAEAERWTLSQRAQWLAPLGQARPEDDDLAWMVSLTERFRRQGASVIRRQNRGLGDEQEGPSALLLKMPKHLYDELMRAVARPYPSQFKEPGLSYIKRLELEAR